MTIGIYYTTFGYLIDYDEYLKFIGFTEDKIPQYIRDQCEGYKPSVLLRTWLAQEHFDGNVNKFELKGRTFSVRMFTHDHDNYEKYLVVGIDVCELDNEEGTVTVIEQGSEEKLKPLYEDVKYAKLIDQCKGNTIYGSDPIFPAPTMIMTTDDCSCCS